VRGFSSGLALESPQGLGGSGPTGDTLDFFSRPTRESDVVAPSNLYAIADGFSGDPVGFRDLDTFGRTKTVSLQFSANGQFANSYAAVRRRHGGRLNIAFCDGHVEPEKFERLFFDDRDEGLRRWNRDDQPHRERLR
jgi:prepilin-type processing-associated H-X9-DG protein